MGACEKRIFAAAVGLTGVCMLALFMTGYVEESAGAGGQQSNRFQWNNTMSAYDKLKEASAWLVGAVSNVINNDNDSVVMPKPILVLYWAVPKWCNWGEGAIVALTSCPELRGQCEFTGDHSRINESDVLIFHMRSTFDYPPRHPPNQKWVFLIRESPAHVYVDLTRLQGVFNLTMTYAMSADVPWLHGGCEPLSPSAHPNHSKTINYADKKKHLVAWFVSNCHTASRRETYVQLLGKHIDVHRYGCGGKYSCPRAKSKICDGRLLNDNYKFYLSFENSLCRDYATEKLWRILQINVVPIVLGNASYSEFLPPHSYIDVRDFASPRRLADYLKVLDANDALYNEYFSWKEKYACGLLANRNGCALCRHALTNRGQTEVVRDLVAEWGRAQNCFNPKQYYRGIDNKLL